MHIRFELTKEDYINYNIYYYFSNSSFKKKRLFWSLFPLAFLLFTIITIKGCNFQKYDRSDLFFLGLGVAAFLIYRPTTKSSIKKSAERVLKNGKNTDLTGEREIIINEHKLVAITNSSFTEYKWNAFEKLEENDRYLFLFVHINNAIVIPKRIFRDEEEINRFRTEVTTKIDLML